MRRHGRVRRPGSFYAMFVLVLVVALRNGRMVTGLGHRGECEGQFVVLRV